MRILHLAWEYPPVMYGGLGRHVHALAQAQAAAGHDVVVITQGQDLPTGADPEVVPDGAVRVLRLPGGARPEGHEELLAHVAAMEGQFSRGGTRMLGTWRPEVLHAHDWMVAHSGVELRAASGAPLVATIHATEAGRRAGWVSTALSARIHEAEGWLATTADAVITCSAAMAEEVRLLFGRADPVVVANGIDPRQWQADPQVADRLRARLAGAGPLLAYTGRVEFEKGVQTLVAAMPEVLAAQPGVRLVVAGRGSHLAEVQRQAASMGLDGAARFLGWVSEEDLRGIVAAADVVVAPSLYEPFGLVALEAATLGTPLVVADTGGLAAFARDGERARTFRPGDAADLAAALLADLRDPAAAAERAARAHAAVLTEYDWGRVAEHTVQVYDLAEVAMARDLPEPDPRRIVARSRHAVRPPQPTDPPGRVLEPRW